MIRFVLNCLPTCAVRLQVLTRTAAVAIFAVGYKGIAILALAGELVARMLVVLLFSSPFDGGEYRCVDAGAVPWLSSVPVCIHSRSAVGTCDIVVVELAHSALVVFCNTYLSVAVGRCTLQNISRVVLRGLNQMLTNEATV